MTATRYPRVIYPGLSGLVSARYTLAHGSEPGQITIRFLGLNANSLAGMGDVIFTDAVNTVTIPGCRIVNGFAQAEGSGFTTTVVLEDRRWTWRYRVTNGEYNIPIPQVYAVPNALEPGQQGELPVAQAQLQPDQFKPDIEEWSKKNVRELAAVLLTDMGETGVNLLALPNDQYPYVKWDAANSAQELEMLCLRYGCRLMWRPDTNRAFIAKLGEGQQLPPFLPGESAADMIGEDPPEPPDEIVVYGAPDEFQVMMETEPVGLDFDGQWKHYNFLSYRPTNGWWGKGPPFTEADFQNINLPGDRSANDAAQLANQYIYRAYRILKTVATPVFPQVLDGSVEYAAFKILPGIGFDELHYRKDVIITPWTCEVSNDDLGQAQVQPMRSYGSCMGGGLDFKDITGVTGEIKIPVATVLPEFGVVVYSQHLMYFIQAGRIAARKPAQWKVVQGKAEIALPVDDTKLYFPTCPIIQCAVRVRDRKTHQIIRWSKTFNITGQKPMLARKQSGTIVAQFKPQQLALVFDDIRHHRITRYKAEGNDYVLTGQYFNNDRQCELKAQYYMRAKLAEFQTTQPQERRYNGIKPVVVDGAIQQVTWEISTGGVFTFASRNTEFGVWIDPYYMRLARKNVNTYQQVKQKDDAMVDKERKENEAKLTAFYISGGKKGF